MNEKEELFLRVLRLTTYDLFYAYYDLRLYIQINVEYIDIFKSIHFVNNAPFYSLSSIP